MSTKRVPRIRRVYSKFIKYPSRKTIAAIVKGLDASERHLRDGEAEMARREEANMRPVSLETATKLAHMIWST